MGNIAIAKERNIYDYSNKNDSINQLKNQLTRYNSSQTGSHSVGINTKSTKNKNKNGISERDNQKRNLTNNCKEELNNKIFRSIFPPPKNCDLNYRKSCRDTSNLRLSKGDKIHYFTNLVPKNNNYLEIIDDSLLCEENQKDFLNNTCENKEADYEINEDYFSLIRNKIEEANDEILDYRRFSRRTIDIHKYKINNKNLKMNTEDEKLSEEEAKIMGNESNSLSQAVTKPNTIDEECDSIKNETLIEAANTARQTKYKEINIHQSSKSLQKNPNLIYQNAIITQEESKQEVENMTQIHQGRFVSINSGNSTSTENLIAKQNNNSSSEDEADIKDSVTNQTHNTINIINNISTNEISNIITNEFELNYVKNSEALRRSYLAKLIYRNIWQPTKKQKDHNSLIIFDWDDTLLCTSFLTPNGIFLDNMRLDRQENEKLKQLDALAYQILSLSVQKADTYIITNAEPGWVEYSAERFYPKVFSILDKVKIVSARGEFEKKHPNNSRQWKIQTFLKMVDEFDTDLITNFICLGDSVIEMEAAHIFASKFTQAFIKTIKFKEGPNLDELIKELTLVTDQFLMIFSAVKNLTIRVERKSKKQDC